ncbi:MAG: hypothetical protein QW051_03675 [Candidatus Aenigmatarchaeota archaeon]
MKNSNLKPVNVLLPEEILKKIEKDSKSVGLRKSTYLRVLIFQRLKENKQNTDLICDGNEKIV